MLGFQERSNPFVLLDPSRSCVCQVELSRRWNSFFVPLPEFWSRCGHNSSGLNFQGPDLTGTHCHQPLHLLASSSGFSPLFDITRRQQRNMRSGDNIQGTNSPYWIFAGYSVRLDRTQLLLSSLSIHATFMLPHKSLPYLHSLSSHVNNFTHVFCC